MNVLHEVVSKGWCVGCGMCAAVCPKGRLEIRWNERGEYTPAEIEGCLSCNENCSLCYQVCPAHGQTKNETEIGSDLYGSVHGIGFRKETGYFLDSFVGHSKEHRLSGASGGMASWTLEALLASGEVDSVAAVGRTSNPDKLFDFKICRSAEEIRACGRSAYYPVEISQVIKYILQNEGRYAIIGLPCVCKAVRLAQDRFPKLKRRITHVLGLTCGHQSSKFFAEYICALGDGNPHDLREIIFRTKDLSQPASNLGITFRSGEGDTVVHKQVLWKDGIGSGYMNGYFQIPGCFYCDDVFAECADAVFMDAWLPEYVNDPKGTSLVLVREKQLFLRIQRALSEGTILCDSTPTDKVVQSQRGVVQRKRLFPLTGKCPIKRKSQNIIYLIDRLVLQQTFKISSATGEIWKKDSEHIYREIKKYLDRIVLIYKIRKMILTPVKFILKKNNR